MKGSLSQSLFVSTLLVFFVAWTLGAESIGPPGGWALAIATHPDSASMLYVGLHGGGIWFSRDSGVHWTEKNSGLNERTVIPILFDPSNPKILYAGTESGIFKSTDAGERWTEVSDGLTCRNVWSLVLDRAYPRRIYAGTSGGGVFRSDDGGAHWKAASEGITNPAIWPLAMGVTADTVFAGTIGGGMFRTHNGGASWQPINVGLANRRVMSLVREPDKRETLFAGTGDGVYKTVDGGDHWWLVSQDLSGQLVFSLRVSGPMLYAGTGTGVFQSRDWGVHWSRIGPAPGENPIVWDIGADPRAPKKLYAGTLGGGIVKSDDGGEHWTSTMTGIRHQLIYSLVAPGNVLYAGTVGSGVVKSNNHGRSWSEANHALSKRVIKAMVVSPLDSETIYVAAEDQFMGGGGGIFKTVDAGKNWKQLTAPDFKRRVFSLAIDPESPQTVYAGADGGYVYASRDAGSTWRSIDGGYISRQTSRNSVYQQSIHPGSVFAIALAPSPHKALYAATDAGVFKTEDGGQQWLDVSESLPDRRVRTLILLPNAPETILAGSGDLGAGGGLFRSTNGGRTWSPTTIKDEWVLALGFDPRDARKLYAGTEWGLYQSLDQGVTWTSLRKDATSRYVLSLVVSPADSTVYAGTEGNGIFAVPLQNPNR